MFSVSALLCMGVCGVRRLEGRDLGTNICCMYLKLMPYILIMKKKMIKYKKKLRKYCIVNICICVQMM